MADNTREEYLQSELFRFGDGEVFSGRDAVEGISIMGALGSGKTTGSGCTIARSFLKAGWGGIVFVSKADELQMWAHSYFAESGRPPAEDLLVIQPAQPHPGAVWPGGLLGPARPFRFNLLQYEYERGGGLTANVVEVLFSGLAAREGQGNRDPFWDQALHEMTLHAMELSVLATRPASPPEIRLDDLLEVILSAPTSFEQLDSARFKAGRCCELIRAADECRHTLTAARFRDLQLSSRYWLQQFPGLAPETRSSIVATFTAKVTGLLRSPLRELLCSETDSDIMPERTLNADASTGRPKVIVVNLPVKLYGEVGRLAQTMIKTVWQHAAERRIDAIEAGRPGWRPAFMWADEAQYFVTAADAGFQQTARSSMVATVYLTQNLPNYIAAIGENPTHSLLGNLQSKVFHANGEPATNEWAESLFGKDLRPFGTNPVFSPGTPSEGMSYGPVVPAIRFTELRKGGASLDPRLDRRVGSYVFQAGRVWRSHRPDRHYHEFHQAPRSAE